MTIDPSARVEAGAVIGAGASIGPYCIVGPNVAIGANCRLIAHVHVTGQTAIGAGCTIYPFASLGSPPQSLKHEGEPTRLEIGAGCTIREHATMNAGTVDGGGVTRVGERGYFMSCTHVGHDCHVGNDVIFATSATLGGHCHVGDHVFMGGFSSAHQFVRVGPQVMVGAATCVRGDVIPFGLASGQYARSGGPQRRRHEAAQVYPRAAGRGAVVLSEAVPRLRPAERLEAVRHLAGTDPAIAEILAFIDADRHRALCLPTSGTAAPFDA